VQQREKGSLSEVTTPLFYYYSIFLRFLDFTSMQLLIFHGKRTAGSSDEFSWSQSPKKKHIYTGYVVFTAAVMKSSVFWNMAPYNQST
jgi:hypothetical protein